jgi:hypothetical protein
MTKLADVFPEIDAEALTLQGEFLEPDGSKGHYTARYYERRYEVEVVEPPLPDPRDRLATDEFLSKLLEQSGTEQPEQPEEPVEKKFRSVQDVFLGFTFSIDTWRHGVEIPYGHVFDLATKKVYPLASCKALGAQDVAIVIRRNLTRPALTLVAPDDSLRVRPGQHFNVATTPAPENQDFKPVDQEMIVMAGMSDVWLNDLKSHFATEQDMLSSLWTTAPGVSHAFGIPGVKRSVRVPSSKESVALSRALQTSQQLTEGWVQALANAALNKGLDEKQSRELAAYFVAENFEANVHDWRVVNAPVVSNKAPII